MIGFAAMAVWLTIGGNRSFVESSLGLRLDRHACAGSVPRLPLGPHQCLCRARRTVVGYVAMLLPQMELF
jgi:hypothetical protein